MNYEKDVSPYVKAAIAGYVSSDRGEFPPHNPHAICGIAPDEEDTYPLAAAWFEGYWARSYCRNGEQRVVHKPANCTNEEGRPPTGTAAACAGLAEFLSEKQS